jgi:hypothetical protein
MQPQQALLIATLWLGPVCALAQEAGADSDRLSAMRRIMPAGATCADLSWEPVSYCRLYSKGATLEIWSGAYGPGATLSFDSVGNEGFLLLPIVRAHFSLAGISVVKLNQCIGNDRGFVVQSAGKFLDLRCHLVEIAGNLALEILPAPARNSHTEPAEALRVPTSDATQ